MPFRSQIMVLSHNSEANQKMIIQLQSENRRLQTKLSSLERMVALRNNSTRELASRSKFNPTQNLSIGPQSHKTLDASQDEKSFKIVTNKHLHARPSIAKFPSRKSVATNAEPSTKKVPGINLVTETQGIRRFDSVVNDWHRSLMTASSLWSM